MNRIYTVAVEFHYEFHAATAAEARELAWRALVAPALEGDAPPACWDIRMV